MKTQKRRDNFGQPIVECSDWREELRRSWFNCMVNTLGLPESAALERASEEIDGSLGYRYCDFLQSQGMIFAGKRILDVGCGLGSLAIEMAKRGGIVVGIEPGEAWRRVAQRRVAGLCFKERITILAGEAEALTCEDRSFDYVTCAQVLEHVKSPKRAIEEMRRVLKPQGIAYVSCENYLAFREQHYKIFWLPLLPKKIGAVYLKIRRRNPSFLYNDITYTTYPQLIWYFLKVGMWSRKWPDKYLSHNRWLQYALILWLQRRDLFGIGFLHFFNVVNQRLTSVDPDDANVKIAN